MQFLGKKLSIVNNSAQIKHKSLPNQADIRWSMQQIWVTNFNKSKICVGTSADYTDDTCSTADCSYWNY